jgi:GTP-binding protein HflX
VGDAAAQAEREVALRAAWPDCIVMSARRADDVALLREAIVAFFRQDQLEAEIFLPWSAQQQRGQIFANCEVLDERADEDGAFLRVRGEREAVERLKEQFSKA